MRCKRIWVRSSVVGKRPAGRVCFRSLSRTERQYAQIEKECLAIVFSCERFIQCLAGRKKITVKSDHKLLQSIFQKTIHAAPCRLQRMMLRLQRFNVEVKYKPGAQMYVADHLSRASLIVRRCQTTFKFSS